MSDPVPPAPADPAPPGPHDGVVPWWRRWSLTPRAAVVLAGAVVAVAVVVVAVGALGERPGGGSAGGVTVTRAPSVAAAGGAGDEPGASGATVPPGSSSSPSGTVTVHVLGAVAHAGVVVVPTGTRVDGVLDRAGGASPDADLVRLNLARPVADGERLYVPRVGEDEVPAVLDPSGAGAVAGGAPSSSDDAVVDLNTADQAALETLPGIGPALAARILAWRDEHGRFTAVEDLLDVSGIGDGRFAELRERVRV